MDCFSTRRSGRRGDKMAVMEGREKSREGNLFMRMMDYCVVELGRPEWHLCTYIRKGNYMLYNIPELQSIESI